MSIILDNSGAIVSCFSYRQIIMKFLHTKILDITHSDIVLYVQKVKRLTWPMLIRNSRQ